VSAAELFVALAVLLVVVVILGAFAFVATFVHIVLQMLASEDEGRG
jgi:hypothetical protein